MHAGKSLTHRGFCFSSNFSSCFTAPILGPLPDRCLNIVVTWEFSKINEAYRAIIKDKYLGDEFTGVAAAGAGCRRRARWRTRAA